MEEEKKEIKTDWYGVCSILGCFIFLVIISCVWWPLLMDVLNSGTSIVDRCAVVVFIGVIGLTILVLLGLLIGMIHLVLKNRRFRSIAYLELVDTREKRTRQDGIDNLLVMPFLIMVCLYCIRGGLRMLSPNYEYHGEKYHLDHEDISKYHLDSVIFCSCFVMSNATVHLLFFAGLTIVSRIFRRMCTLLLDDTFEKLEKVYRVLPQFYLVLNMIIFLGLYKYAVWPIHMKRGIFAAYFFSLSALLVIAVLTERIDRGKLVESPSWKNDKEKLVASPGWKNLVQSPNWKNADTNV